MTVLLAFLAFLGGIVLGWVGVMIAYIIATVAFGYFDREGATAMGLAFTVGPFVGLLTGIAAAAFVIIRRANRR